MEGNVEMEDAFDSKKGDGVFVVGYEVDFDYEFDASKCFDFSREETEMEARVAEMWFQTARGHDPSRMYFFEIFSDCFFDLKMMRAFGCLNVKSSITHCCNFKLNFFIYSLPLMICAQHLWQKQAQGWIFSKIILMYRQN